MVTGFEVVGVVLAALPILMKVSKAVVEGAADVRRVFGQSYRNAELQEFHNQFWMETFWLHRHLRQFVQSLPAIPNAVSMRLHGGIDLDLWETNQSVKDAALERLGEEDFEAFLVILERILGLLNRIIKDCSTQISPLGSVSNC